MVADPANPKVAYVSLNLGIARYTNSDDQLAGVIGHELEHPQSDLGAEQRRIRNIPSTYGVREYADVVKAWQLGRLEEIEVDVKSVYNALIEGGFNPYEYQRLIENFERDFGNSDGGSHARTSSRDTALTLELAGVRHGQGREIKTTGSEHNLINPTLHSHIDAVHGLSLIHI